MKIFNYTLILFLGIWSCSKEDVLSPSPENEAYELPDNGYAFDKTIAGYLQKYGSYIYYNFTDKEAYWSPTGYKNTSRNADGTYVLGYEVAPAAHQYIPQQLQLLKEGWLDYYSESYLKKFLPIRILLCSTIDSAYTEWDFTSFPIKQVLALESVDAWSNFDHLAVSYGNSHVQNMSQADSLRFFRKLNSCLLENMLENNRLEPSDAFANLTNYESFNNSQQDAYGRGIITIIYNSPSALSDWKLYMEAMLTYSETQLKTQTTDPEDTSLAGILNPAKDTNGLIQKRYDIVRQYYIDHYGMDLQTLGNRQ